MSKLTGYCLGLRGLLLRGREPKPPGPGPPLTPLGIPDTDLLLWRISRGGGRGIDDAQSIHSQWRKLPWASLTPEINDSVNRKPLRRGQRDPLVGASALRDCRFQLLWALARLSEQAGSEYTASRP